MLRVVCVRECNEGDFTTSRHYYIEVSGGRVQLADSLNIRLNIENLRPQ